MCLLPLGVLTAVTAGALGSGVELVNGIPAHRIASQRRAHGARPPPHDHGVSNTGKVVHVDQSPIGRAAAALRIRRPTRAKFRSISFLPKHREAKVRGLRSGPGRFNVKGGRCESCKGETRR